MISLGGELETEEETTIHLEETSEDTVNADDLFGGELETEEETTIHLEETSEDTVNADDLFGGELETEEETTQSIPTNLDDAITAINENFSDLPPAQNLPTPPIPKAETETTPTPQPETKKSPKKSSQPSIRVDVERLQAMDNQLGELVIQRNSLAVQNEQLQRELRELLNRFSRFQNLVGRLQEFSDQEVIRESTQKQSRLSPQKQQTDSSPVSEQPESVLDIDFDSLELDQYGALNAILQELLEETAQIEESVGDVSLFADQSNQTLQGQRKMLEQLRDELIWARMLPLSNILDRFPRILRDFSDQYQKPTRLSLEGTGVRVDKSVLEKLYDPLTHLIRNAFDHGIEATETREQNGKSEEGEIAIRAYYQGNQTVIEISDDGGGIDVEKVKAKALQTGLLSEDQAERFSKERLYNLLFEPGFSTAKEVTELSGRGVGLDVVRDQIQALKGSISLQSKLGQGTTFILSLPTTQSMAKLLIVLVDTTIWALPSDNIEQIIVPMAEQVKNTGNQRFLWWEDQATPIYTLRDLLDYNCPLPAASPDLQALGAATQGQNRSRPLLILKRGEQRYPLELDRVITEQELVIKSLGSAIAPPEYVSGCTILGDGRIVPVMDVFALLQSVQQTPQASVVTPTPTRSLNSKIPTILVVDDSATQRQTLNFSLQRAGYQVLQAGDGREAISMLERYPDTNLVVCDIEMPNLNGFEFLRYRRQNNTLNQIPVVMLTSRSSDKHRKLCTHLGASHYFTKPYLEKDFLGTLKTIIDQ
ncbi:putative CheA signal transduction histidine kinase [Halothece sp. PCC 7418]|uniref:hybrid sensor histidine kinase/response regulator n=1 Tax=Halothece sp. (strain PCC 7418) TaxID=65093 RepID=UPI0002A08B77|nr:hybrid sensor histidine kinase/response regulator [Halothece sp. PCC 7418]AFZ44964.1 putative CheA signal transduction histidine kinase [Halothece sp. PCC 7418]